MIRIYAPTGTPLIEVEPSDSSYRYRAIMGENALTLYFSTAEHVEIPTGAYCSFEGERYTLLRPEALKMLHSRHFEYTLTMEAPEKNLSLWLTRNIVDGRLTFPLTATPREHLQQVIDNANAHDGGGWTIGICIDGIETLISYDKTTLADALTAIATAFGTEYEVNGKEISLRKIEYLKDHPLSLSYGRGNGLLSGVTRTNSTETPPVDILYVQGGERNIDPSKYGGSFLRLPKAQAVRFDGARFEGEVNFDAQKARSYLTSADGLSVVRTDTARGSIESEAALSLTDIYPKRVGVVSEVIVSDAEKNFYDFTDTTIPETLDYEKCLIAGETMTIVFQSGMLAGREFDVKYTHTSTGSGKAGKRFEIVPSDMDGMTMPSGNYIPRRGDKYAVFHCALPNAYINSGAETKEGAEWELLRSALATKYESETPMFTFGVTLDPIFANRAWASISPYTRTGAYISFHDARFQPEAIEMRITGVKQFINSPRSPELELSNKIVTASYRQTLEQKQADTSVAITDTGAQITNAVRRSWRDVKETIAALEQAMIEGFTDSINPLTVATMAMLVGTPQMQFRFTDDGVSPVTPRFAYDPARRSFYCLETELYLHPSPDSGTLTSRSELSGGIEINTHFSATLAVEDASKTFYLYASIDPNRERNEFLLSPTARPMTDSKGWTYYLVGVLSSEKDGGRTFAPLYGITEILPSRISTERIQDVNGISYFDLARGTFRFGSLGAYLAYANNALRLHNAQLTLTNQQGAEMVRLNPSDGSGFLAGGNVAWTGEGDLSIRGFMRPLPIEITDDNYNKYLTTDNIYYGAPYYDINKTGQLIIFTEAYRSAEQYDVLFPSLHTWDTFTSETQEKLATIRSFIGTNVTIYNNSNRPLTLYGNIHTTEEGARAEEETTGTTSVRTIATGMFATLRCTALTTSEVGKDAREVVAWIISIGKATQLSQ